MKNEKEVVITTCPKCGSDKIKYQIFADGLTGDGLTKKALGFAIFGWFSFLKPPTNDDKSTTYLFCEACGYKVNPALEKQKAKEKKTSNSIRNIFLFIFTITIITNLLLIISEPLGSAFLVISLIIVFARFCIKTFKKIKSKIKK